MKDLNTICNGKVLHILNCAIITSDGTHRRTQITKKQAQELLDGVRKYIVSYVGHSATCEYILDTHSHVQTDYYVNGSTYLDRSVCDRSEFFDKDANPHRREYKAQKGDIALVVTLKQRLQTIKDLSREEIEQIGVEYYLLECVECETGR